MLETEAPSAVPYATSDVSPTALDRDGLARVRNAFAESARRAARLGIDAAAINRSLAYTKKPHDLLIQKMGIEYSYTGNATHAWITVLIVIALTVILVVVSFFPQTT